MAVPGDLVKQHLIGEDSTIPTLSELASEFKIPADIAAALWLRMGVDPEEDLLDVASIPKHILDQDLESFYKEANLPLIMAGRLSRFFSKVQGFGVHQSEGEPEVAAPLAAGTPNTAVAVIDPPAKMRMRLSQVLDQGDDTQFDLIDDAKRQLYRANHKTTTGDDPLRNERPSPEQLGALAFQLARGGSPYADFGIWTAHANRFHMFHKFDAQVFIDNKLQKNALKGPSDIEAWKSCWAVFRAAMLSVGGASPSSLDAYAKGISTLSGRFPGEVCWGIIFCGDVLCRSEMWNAIREDLVDDLEWPAKFPWDLVIRRSCYAGKHINMEMFQWWEFHVVIPCSSTSPLSSLRRYEGTDLLPLPNGWKASAPAASSHQGGYQGPASKKQRKAANRGVAAQHHWVPHPQEWRQQPRKGGKGKGKEGKGKGKCKDGKPDAAYPRK